jgi:nitrite reductase (NAD(P)H)
MCPHRRAFVLSDGLVGEDANGNEYVSCPLHKRNYQLNADPSQGGGSCSDSDYSIMTFEAKEDLENDQILLKLPPTDALDAILSTSKWMLLKAKEESDLLAGDSNHSIEFAEPRSRMDDTRGDESRPTVACGGGSSLDW